MNYPSCPSDDPYVCHRQSFFKKKEEEVLIVLHRVNTVSELQLILTNTGQMYCYPQLIY